MCFALGGLLAGCGKPIGETARRAEAPLAVSVAPVTLTPLDRSVTVVGRLQPRDEATLSAEVEGKVERMAVDFGDRVQAGQLLAQIDTTTYDALARQAAANLARALACLTNAESDLNRVQQLIKDKIASPADLDKAVAMAAQARADVKAAEANETVARNNLQRSHVCAPFPAAIAERVANAGDFLRVGTQLFRVVNDRTLRFTFQVLERYAGKVQPDAVVRFAVDAWPGQTNEGRVFLINPAVNPATCSFTVAALVDNPDLKLKAGSFARGELLFERNVPSLVVPLDAVLIFAGVTKVFVVENGVARSRQVQAGRVLEGKQEILSGLKAGETVVTSGQSRLVEGRPVRIKET